MTRTQGQDQWSLLKENLKGIGKEKEFQELSGDVILFSRESGRDGISLAQLESPIYKDSGRIFAE